MSFNDSAMEGMAPTPKFFPSRAPRRMLLSGRHRPGHAGRPFTFHVYPNATVREHIPGRIHRHPLIAERTIPPAHDWKPSRG